VPAALAWDISPFTDSLREASASRISLSNGDVVVSKPKGTDTSFFFGLYAYAANLFKAKPELLAF
jgi:hypothetical protein